jgi:6-phosphogluconolactonase
LKKLNLTEYSSRESASSAAAEFLGGHLKKTLELQSRAVLMVSGGSSPVVCLGRLSEYPLVWSRVDVTLTDERLVSVTDDASNEKMVRETLITNAASHAQFCELSATNSELIASARPVCLVGMGEDGHFASIFPDNTMLDQLVNPKAEPAAIDITTKASSYPRRTVNLAMVLQSRVILLLVYGDKKRQVLDAPSGLPVHHLIQQSKAPVNIYWAP